MLFCAEILSFKTALGQLWLAGTIGTKKKPFNRHSILASNIEELCTAIIKPKRPIAPKLSGVFLVGLCEIYKQKFIFLQNDILELIRRLHPSDPAKRPLPRSIPTTTCRREVVAEAESLFREIDIEPDNLLNWPDSFNQDDSNLSRMLWDNKEVTRQGNNDIWDDSIIENAMPFGDDFDDRLDDMTTNIFDIDQEAHGLDNDLLADVIPPLSPPLPSLPSSPISTSLDPQTNNRESINDMLSPIAANSESGENPPLNTDITSVSDIVPIGTVGEASDVDCVVPEDRAHQTMSRNRVMRLQIDRTTTMSAEIIERWKNDSSAPSLIHDLLKELTMNTTNFLSSRIQKVLDLETPTPIDNEPIYTIDTPHVPCPIPPIPPVPRIDSPQVDTYRTLESDLEMFGYDPVERLRGIMDPGIIQQDDLARDRRGPSIGGTSMLSGRPSTIDYDPMADIWNNFESPITNDRTSLMSRSRVSEMGFEPATHGSRDALSRECGHVSDSRREGEVENQYTIETWKFKQFIDNHLRQIDRHKHRLENNTSTSCKFVFQHVLPPVRTDRLTLVRSFYHTLTLLSKGDIHVSQNTPLGDICINNSLECMSPTVPSSRRRRCRDDRSGERIEPPWKSLRLSVVEGS